MMIKGKSSINVPPGLGADGTIEVDTNCFDTGVVVIGITSRGGGHMMATAHVTLSGARAIAASITAACDDHESIMNLERAADADDANIVHTGLEKCSDCGLTLARCSSGLTCIHCDESRDEAADAALAARHV